MSKEWQNPDAQRLIRRMLRELAADSPDGIPRMVLRINIHGDGVKAGVVEVMSEDPNERFFDAVARAYNKSINASTGSAEYRKFEGGFLTWGGSRAAYLRSEFTISEVAAGAGPIGSGPHSKLALQVSEPRASAILATVAA